MKNKYAYFIFLIFLFGVNEEVFSQAPPSILPVPGFARQFARPIDSTIVWTNYNQMLNYASTSAVAYVGQVISLNEGGVSQAYVINQNRSISAIGGNISISGPLNSSSIITNEQASAINFVQGIRAQINHITNNNESIIQIAFDEGIPNIVYRGFYSGLEQYTTNDLVTLATDLRLDPTDSIVLGQNYFLDSYIAVGNVSNSTPFPNSTNWNLLLSRGQRGFDGVGNIVYDEREWSASYEYPTNILISFDEEIYISVTNVPISDGGQNIYYPNTSPQYWRKVVRRGEDATSTDTTIILIPTNIPVRDLNFRGAWNPLYPGGYAENDLVAHDLSSWYSLTDANVDMPTIQSTKWAIFVAKGIDGASSTFLDLQYLGGWDKDYPYETNQLVTSGGSLWTPKQPNQGSLPPIYQSIVDGSYENDPNWELVIQRGLDGFRGTVFDGTFIGPYRLDRGYRENDLVTTGDGILWRAKRAVPIGSIPIRTGGVDGPDWESIVRSGRDGEDGIGLSYQGRWDQNRFPRYTTNQVVYHRPPNSLGGLWVCVRDHLNDLTAREPTDTSIFWERVLSEGPQSVEGLELVYKGVFQLGAAYSTNEVVRDIAGFNLWRPLGEIPAGNSQPPYEPAWEIFIRGPNPLPGTPGPEGPAGPQGPPGFGNLIFYGEWTNNFPYTTNDIVRYSNRLWKASENISPANQTPPNTGQWQIFLRDGVDGDAGQNAIGDMFFMGEFSTNRFYTTNQMVYYSNAVYVVTNYFSGETNVNGFITPPTVQNIWLKLFEGTPGEEGRSIINATLSGFDLVLQFSDSTQVNVGNVRGQQGEIGPPGVDLTFRENYETNTTYYTNNLVAWEGNTYFATVDAFSNIPPTDSSYWQLFVSRGDIGPTGLPGSIGPQGLPGGTLGARGEWSATNEYSTNHFVYWNGSAYYSLINTNIGNIPDQSATWQIFVQKGATGEVGRTPTVSVGPTTTLGPGSSATVSSFIDTNNNTTLSFFIPRGDDGEKGDAGAALTFSGNWDEDTEYDASNLVIYAGSTWYSLIDNNISNTPDISNTNWLLFVERGNDGDPGPIGQTFIVEAGTVTTLAAGESATVENTISGNTNTLSFGIPRGAQGIPGIGLNYLGSWSAETNYSQSNLVTFSGSTWYSLQDNNSNNIPTNAASTYWSAFVERGPVGETGATGALFIVEAAGALTVTNEPAAVENNIVGGTNFITFKIPVGPRGEQGDPGIGLVYFGEWNAETNYSLSNLVTHSGSTWYSSHNDNSNNTPQVETTNWQLFISRGEIGPTGQSSTISIGSVYSISTTNATVTNRGTASAAILDFQIPIGPKGDAGAALIYSGEYDTNINYSISNLVSYAGSTWFSTHNDNSNSIPDIGLTNWTLFVSKGDVGPTGTAGVAATIEVGEVFTVTNQPATVQNTGTASAAVFKFEIPIGPQGPQGNPGVNLYIDGTWTNTKNYSTNSLVLSDGKTWYSLIDDNSNNVPAVTSEVWGVFISSDSALDLTNYMYIAGGGEIKTDGRLPGQFIMYSGDGVYTHEFSSVNWVIAGDKTNHPLSGIAFQTSGGITISHDIQTNNYSIGGVTSVVKTSVLTLGGGGGSVTGDYVQSVNALTGAVNIIPGANITILTNAENNTLEISSSGGGGSIEGGYVKTLNTFTNDVTIAAGTNVTLQSIDGVITINATTTDLTLEGASNATFISLGGSTVGLVNFNTNETVFAAINTFDEIFGEIAPANADPLNALASSGFVPFSAKLSIIEDDSAVFPPGYTLGTTYSRVSKGDGSFIIANSPSATTFNFADRGWLQLYINTTNRDSLDLGSKFNSSLKAGSQTWPNSAGFGDNGILDMVSVEKYGISVWQKGLVNIVVSNQLLRRGWNEFYLVHSNSTFERVSQTNSLYYDWDPQTQSHHAVSISANVISTNWMSGIAHASNFVITSSATFSNMFKNVYNDTDPVKISSSFGGLADLVIPLTNTEVFSGVSVPPTNTQTLSLNSAAITNSGQYSATNIPIQIQSKNGYGEIVNSASNFVAFLVNSYNMQSDSGNTENFNNERRRLPHNFDFDSTSATLTGLWTSETVLVNGQLQQIVAGNNDNRLVYPSDNFSSGFVPSQTADYSTFSQTQVYYRAFTTTEAGKANIDLLLTGNFSTSDIGSVGSGSLNVEIKLGDGIWKDAEVSSALPAGARRAIASYSGGVLTLRLTFGTDTIANSGGRFYTRISYLPSAGNKYLSAIEAQFP